MDLDRAYQDYAAVIRRAKLNHIGEAAPAMEPLSGAELQVFGSKNCQFFTAPDVWQVAGSLANGRYKAIARSKAAFSKSSRSAASSMRAFSVFIMSAWPWRIMCRALSTASR